MLERLQSLGQALMLPIAVLPIAAILLRVGQNDLLDMKFIAEAGGTIFSHLSLIFAIGVALGLAKDNAGAAALSGAIGWFILDTGLKTIDPNINMGVFSGIIIGICAALLYNRFYNIALPEFLAFFGGKRFVPIITGFIAIVLAGIFGETWPHIQEGLKSLGGWITGSGEVGAFIYGISNRALIPTGLHHVLNSLVWFEFGEFSYLKDGVETVAKGDLNRFFAGDASAGLFMAGFFPIMMGGLPGAALAMYLAAKKEQKAAIGSVLFSAAFTAFLTGVTEPFEFIFIFMAPLLYGFHAILTGVFMALCSVLDIKLGFGFSAGLFDFVLNWNKATNPSLAVILIFVAFAIYFGIFYIFIKAFDIEILGREKNPSSKTKPIESSQEISKKAQNYIEALGGAENIEVLTNCITRLRLNLKDKTKLYKDRIKELGARGVVEVGENGVQIIIGPLVEQLANEMKRIK